MYQKKTREYLHEFEFSSVQFSRFATSWIAARQTSQSITNSRNLLKPMSIESVIPSGHLILCCPLLLQPPIPPSIRVFSNKSTLRIRWPKYWSFSFSISPSNKHPGLISPTEFELGRVKHMTPQVQSVKGKKIDKLDSIKIKLPVCILFLFSPFQLLSPCSGILFLFSVFKFLHVSLRIFTWNPHLGYYLRKMDSERLTSTYIQNLWNS